MAEGWAAAKILGPLTESIAKAATSNALSAGAGRHRGPSPLRSRGALRGLACARLRRQGFRIRLRGRAFAAAQLERRGDLRLTLQRIAADFPRIVTDLPEAGRGAVRKVREQPRADRVGAAARVADGERHAARPENVHPLIVRRVLDHCLGEAPFGYHD